MLEIGPSAPRLLKAGLISIRSDSTAERLRELNRGLTELIKTWQPEVLALERLFFAKNQKTALAVAEARGVILLTAALEGSRVYEYTPLEVKKALTGDGRADKTQIKKVAGWILKDAAELKAPDDVFDAIALAFTCHLLKEKNNKGR